MNNQRIHFSIRFLVLGLVAITLLLGIGLSSLAFAATEENQIEVNTTKDIKQNNDDLCSLREAIIAANTDKKSGAKDGECKAGNGADVIILQPNTVYTLSRTDNGNEDSSQTGDLDIVFGSNITIRPSGTGIVVIQGDNDFTDRILHVLSGGILTVKDVTIRKGNVKGNGGGVYTSNGGELTMTNVTLTANNARERGGALFNNGSTNLNYITVQGNNAALGGDALVNSSGTLSLSNSYIEDSQCLGTISTNGTSNLAPAGSNCNATHSESVDPLLTLLPYDFDLDNMADYFLLHEDSNAIDAAESSCPTASPDPLDMVRPQGDACDLGANEVEETNKAPVAADQTVTINEDAKLEEDITFALEVSDPNGLGDLNLSLFKILDNTDVSAHGTLTGPFFGPHPVSNEDAVLMTYTPNAHFDESVSFVYYICDIESVCTGNAADYVDDSNYGSLEKVTIDILPDNYIEVTNRCDYGTAEEPVKGSLRWATEQANNGDTADPGPDRIVFDILDTASTSSCGLINGDQQIINLVDGLTILDPVILDGLGTDGNFPARSNPYIVLSGLDSSGACTNSFSGITISDPDGSSSILNLIIQGMGGSGIVIGTEGTQSNGNLISGNEISGNGCSAPAPEDVPEDTIIYNDGVTIVNGVNNYIVDNNIYANAGESVDLGGDGPTANDIDDEDSGPNYEQNYPVLMSATPGNSNNPNQIGNKISGYLDTIENQPFAIEFFVSESCGTGGTSNSKLDVTFDSPNTYSEDPVTGGLVSDPFGNIIYTGADGIVDFIVSVQNKDLMDGEFITSTATSKDPSNPNNTSEYSVCLPVDDTNVVWPLAWELGSGQTVSQTLSQVGQSKWYKFKVEPNSRFKVRLDMPAGLEQNYDLVVFNDILTAYQELIAEADPDLDEVNAEFPNDAFAPSVYSPSVYSPSVYSPSVYSPSVYSPSVYSPALYLPSVYSPDVYSPSVYSPSVYSPSVYSPSVYSPSVYSPSVYSGGEIVGDAYSAAQMISLIGVSGSEGQLPEELNLSSYNNGGYYYARVRGRQGGFNPEIKFTLSLEIEGGICDGISDDLGTFAPLALETGGPYETVILVDYGRMGLSSNGALAAKLDELAADPSVNGVVVDVADDAEVVARNALADTFVEGGNKYRICPYAKNLVADSIKEIIDDYRAVHPIKYVVIIGDDDDIPFYRYPDQSGLGPEEDYVVPVQYDSASFASLNNNYFLGQDAYVSKVGLAVKNDTLPIPDIGIGRMVETETEIMHMIDVYLATPELVPQNALVTAYDFLTNGGDEVVTVLADSLGEANVNDTLVVPSPETWTADDLAANLDSGSHDIVFLSGHFSANSTLAADYETYYLSTDFINTPVDYTDALFYSAGCHSGYNIVNDHGIENYTIEPDWAAAMAQKGATLIAGTGYQYGDTDFVEYSERLYLEFTRYLRSGAPNEPIAIGDALVKAKQEYLKDTPDMRGIHQKALLEATIYGLPMKKVNMPGDRINFADVVSTVTSGEGGNLNLVTSNPGAVLGLQTYPLNLSYDSNDLVEIPNPLQDFATGEWYDGVSKPLITYMTGPDGKVVNPGEPVLPLDVFDATVTDAVSGEASNMVLRGVGFVGGQYEDFERNIPLVGAATTEESAVHFDFLSFVFYRQQMFTINRFDALIDGLGGQTLLNVFPVQYKSEEPTEASPEQTATKRQFDSLEFTLYYLPEDFMNAIEPGSNRPDLAAAPTIVSVQGNPVCFDPGCDIEFEVEVVGEPSAGMQQVWVTYTRESDPLNLEKVNWTSLPLNQDNEYSMIWRETLPGTNYDGNPRDLRFIAQAVSGTGLVTMANNLGRFYIPGGGQIETKLVELSGPEDGKVGTTATFSARLLDIDDNPITGKPVLFDVGLDSRLGWTDNDGYVSVNVPIYATAPIKDPTTPSGFGIYEVEVSFPGTADYLPTTANLDFTVLPQATIVTLLDPTTVFISGVHPDVPLYARLNELLATDPDIVLGRPLAEKTITFIIRDPNIDPTDPNSVVLRKAVITDQDGEARLGRIDLPLPVLAMYSVTAEYGTEEFGGNSSYLYSGESTPPGTINTVIILADDDPTDNIPGDPVVWPTNNKILNIDIVNADGSPIDGYTTYYQSIEQDEPLTDGADGNIDYTDQVVVGDKTLGKVACVRASRDGNGNGRVYRIKFSLIKDNPPDPMVSELPDVIPGEAFIATIPHDNSGDTTSINDAPPYINSIGDGSVTCN
jgi:CSLREA domain-containing protein